MPDPTTSHPSAGLVRRLAALVYDSFLLFGITAAYAGLVLAVRVWTTGAEAAQVPYSGLPRLLLLTGWWFCLAIFYCWCWRRGGQTLGMKIWRLQLQQLDGSSPTWRQCWLRCLLAPLSLAALGIGYLWCLIRSGDCLYDIWSHTRVIVIPKASTKASPKTN